MDGIGRKVGSDAIRKIGISNVPLSKSFCPFPRASQQYVRDVTPLRNKGDGQVSGKFNLFHKLASRGSLRLNPEKLYRSVYESFHPTSAPSFPSDYRSVIVARFLGTENLETTPTTRSVKRKKDAFSYRISKEKDL